MVQVTRHVVTRFAPSPTGRLHIGHGWSALMAYDAARESDGAFRLRIEDIDGTRSRPEHIDGILEDLVWLGIDWAGEPIIQSTRASAHRAALDRLIGEGLAYPCFCTRADILAQIAASGSAPHGPEGPVYPGTCREMDPAERLCRLEEGQAHAWRLDMARSVARVGALRWHDEGRGWIDAEPSAAGDIVLSRKDAPGSYHLCATLDDAEMGITLIVRGQDLFEATHVHRLLQALLDLPTPAYRHHALLVDAEGRRLAKRDAALTLSALRAQGVSGIELAGDLRAGRFPLGIRVA
ncbi:tRNA glutamyl-Q(34) synthetase GluQRS [Sphingobium sp. CR28]|uniref:tRNA glutamyl-Q(34) synthetase GluQRS n=1 Tax=Sphingobium sp. CR28 TaxID=3400272 RepID=UPI003FEFA096